MASSNATSVEAYLAELTEDRRTLVGAIRDVVNAHLPEGYAEGMQYGMIGWFVPHERYPKGYHTDKRQPLPLAGLASQKQYVSLYLMGTYCGCESADAGLTADATWFRGAWTATGRKLDMGRACVRVKRLTDVPLEVVGEAIARLPVDTYVERYEASLEQAAAARKARR
jgi:hypothetical protein